MQYTYLGRTGLKVSKLCLGTMNFGPMTEEKEAFRIMDEAVDAGINFFDTADMYGAHTSANPDDGGHSGWTEEIIGRWFKLGGGRRDKVILATKLYMPMGDTDFGPNDGFGLSAVKIRRRLEGSLRRLQTDHIDLYQMHRPERRTTWEEMWAAYEQAIAQGKISYVGSSNFEAYDLAKAQWAADKRGSLGLVTEQHRYSLIRRYCERDLIPACEDLGLGLICWSPLAAGLLGGNALKKQKEQSRSGRAQLTEHQVEQLTAYGELCQELGYSQANVGLAWLMHQKAVTAPLTGPRTVEQLRAAIPSADIRMDQETLNRLDEIFPPCPPVPEGGILKPELMPYE